MKLTVRKSEAIDDWWIIERAEHDGKASLAQIGEDAFALQLSSRFSDADVEGTTEEMLAIAQAITSRSYFSAKRCAVVVSIAGSVVEFWSPRNSQRRGACTLGEADALAFEIREKCSGTAGSP